MNNRASDDRLRGLVGTFFSRTLTGRRLEHLTPNLNYLASLSGIRLEAYEGNLSDTSFLVFFCQEGSTPCPATRVPYLQAAKHFPLALSEGLLASRVRRLLRASIVVGVMDRV